MGTSCNYSGASNVFQLVDMMLEKGAKSPEKKQTPKGQVKTSQVTLEPKRGTTWTE